ncbi:MAG: aldehyde ferredoxin oxidoreductase N-terminal domain-containing protein [Thermodesulfobacteriota bacterium]|jgi:aldehyde:ferredoxin oxidoreductase
MVLKRKIAFIDLSKNSVEIAPVPVDVREKLLGGRGINMYFLSRIYESALDPFSPKNRLIFGAGLIKMTWTRV